MYTLPLNNTGLNCAGPLICRLFSINILEKYLEICNFKKIFSALLFYKNIVPNTYNIKN